jgi:virulence-associated protein VagC
MYKLNAFNVTGSIKFEQIFNDFATMSSKEVELRESGMSTVITPITKEEVNSLGVKLLEDLSDMFITDGVNN